MAGPTRFDDSLERLASAVESELGRDGLAAGMILRDVTGRLSFFANTAVSDAIALSLRDKLAGALGSYAREDRVLVLADEAGAQTILKDQGFRIVVVGASRARLLDRRLVGADWLRSPAPFAERPPRFVFTSLKGGVGRSTSLAVVASHVAGRGGRVLAIDFDLESPGLGAFLLTEGTVPEFGSLDALVENTFGFVDDSFRADMIGPSSLAAKGGKIDVVPAFGRRSLRNPQNILAKIARAYAEDLRRDGGVATILDQVRELVDSLADASRYDVVLVDARAGLHESTAATILGLGAEVLLFGQHEPQTFQGYAPLLAHLAGFLPDDGPVPEWVERLTPVHAKAPSDSAVRSEFDQTWQALVTKWFPLRTEATPVLTEQAALGASEFRDLTWDEAAEDDEVLPRDWSLRTPIAVLRDDRYERFNPLVTRDLLEERLYRTTFGALLERIDAAVFPSTGTESGN